MDPMDVDDERLEIAKAHLDKVDLVGVNEHYDAFVDEMRTRFGWHFDDLPNKRVGDEPWEASAALKERIAHDNHADMAFYEYAKSRAVGRDKEPVES
jgi:hypothetical protein